VAGRFQKFGGTSFLVFSFEGSFTINTEATCPSKTLLPIYKVTWRYVPEESNLHLHSPKDPEFHNLGLDHC
jgi:hypothetical protein